MSMSILLLFLHSILFEIVIVHKLIGQFGQAFKHKAYGLGYLSCVHSIEM